MTDDPKLLVEWAIAHGLVQRPLHDMGSARVPRASAGVSPADPDLRERNRKNQTNTRSRRRAAGLTNAGRPRVNTRHPELPPPSAVGWRQYHTLFMRQWRAAL
ncbi:MAG: hypothetical protein ACYDH9_08075 [Limisphaerales bacterium]